MRYTVTIILAIEQTNANIISQYNAPRYHGTAYGIMIEQTYTNNMYHGITVRDAASSPP